MNTQDTQGTEPCTPEQRQRIVRAAAARQSGLLEMALRLESEHGAPLSTQYRAAQAIRQLIGDIE